MLTRTNSRQACESTSIGSDRSEVTRSLLARRALTEEAEERRLLCDEIVRLHLQVAEGVAKRYVGRGIDDDDLRQAAYLGLFAAVLRFDASRGDDFISFAVPTIRGEVQRHFRDHGWMVRPPRRIQELQPRIHQTRELLTGEWGRSPTPSEVARQLGVSTDDVVEALAVDGCFAPTSLDLPPDADSNTPLADSLAHPGGGEGGDLDAAEARAVLGPLMRALPRRDRDILWMRFGEGMSQGEIGRRIGVTQAQVSRLLAQTLAMLRHEIGATDPLTSRTA